MSFFHKKNVTKCLGHHYAIWTKNFFLDQPKLALISGTVYKRCDLSCEEEVEIKGVFN